MDTKETIGPQLKYLGLTLDECWNFENYLAEATRRAGERAAKLDRLLLNLGRPGR